MRLVFDATWARLSEREQALFAALSVFRGGFTAMQGQAVAGAAVGDFLRLVDRSLLARGEQERFKVHELLRQFAAERLEQSGEAERVKDQHSAYFMELLAGRLPQLKGAQFAALDAIATDFDNMRAAWRRAIESSCTDQMVKANQSLNLIRRAPAGGGVAGPGLCAGQRQRLAGNRPADLPLPPRDGGGAGRGSICRSRAAGRKTRCSGGRGQAFETLEPRVTQESPA